MILKSSNTSTGTSLSFHPSMDLKTTPNNIVEEIFNTHIQTHLIDQNSSKKQIHYILPQSHSQGSIEATFNKAKEKEDFSSYESVLSTLKDHLESFSCEDLKEFILEFNKSTLFSHLEDSKISFFYQTIFNTEQFKKIQKNDIEELIKKTPIKGKIPLLTCALAHSTFKKEDFKRLFSLQNLFTALCLQSSFEKKTLDSFLQTYFKHPSIQHRSRIEPLLKILSRVPESCKDEVLYHILIHKTSIQLSSDILLSLIKQTFLLTDSVLIRLFSHPNIQNLSNESLLNFIYENDKAKQNKYILIFLACSKNRKFEYQELVKLGEVFTQNTNQISDLETLFTLIYLRGQENQFEDSKIKCFLLSLIWNNP